MSGWAWWLRMLAPLVRRHRGTPDALTLAIVTHIADVTNDADHRVLLNPRNEWGGNLIAWWLVQGARLRALREAAAAYAEARPWAPWWPGAARLWRGQVECGCGDCRAYVMEGGEGYARYPRQPAAWWASDAGPVERSQRRA